MPGSTAIDVAIGLIFVYVMLSLVCSVANETVASALGWRSQFLRKGLANLLVNTNEKDVAARTQQVETNLATFFENPLVAPMVGPPSGLFRKKQRNPSYIPSRTFVAALMQGARAAAGADAELKAVIAKLPPGRVQEAFTELYVRANGEANRFTALAEEWYDDAMERVSGWYKRRVHLFIWLWAIVLAAALNADTIRIARSLWTDKAVRAAVVQQAQNQVGQGSSGGGLGKVATDVSRLQQIKVPMGWTHKNAPHSFWQGLSKILGLLLTAAALSLGAPFWFDLLSKVARLRQSGAPPPAAGAKRVGEGEETRTGPATAT
jgi:hypothetical protein